ncbi:hypothetical protein ACKWTF_015042 [Chironomus riparius]
MNILIIFPITLLFLASIESKRSLTPTIDFKFLNCKCLLEPWYADEYVYKNWTCFAKNWSRNMSTVNADFTLIKPLYKIFIECIFFYKYGTIYRQVLKFPKVDYCNLMTLMKDNIFAKQIYLILKTAAPDLIHDCPFYNLKLINFTLPIQSFLSEFSSGEYKLTINLYMKENGPIASNCTFTGAYRGNFKDSFG